ncbi:DinB family protein [Paenibacillus tarimensis]
MNYDFNRKWLVKKFEEIQRRTLNAIEQLSDEQLNWKPDEHSHNIPTLLRHIEGNVRQRIRNGILNEAVTRNRDEEFSSEHMTKTEAQLLVQSNLQIVIDVIKNIKDEGLRDLQTVRGRERTNLDMLHQCAAHYSEHMGQILYIAKLILKEKYKSTSV